MKDSMITTLVEDFMSKNPGVTVEVNTAGAGTLMRQIEEERASGAILADVIWTSEIPDFYYMKNEGLLLQYAPAGVERIMNPLDGTDDYFSPARLGTMGIAYNTDLIETPPISWNDLKKPEYKDSFTIADPTTSGTAMMGIMILKEAFGEQFFHDLRANGAFIGQGSTQVINAVADGEIAACLAVDYITFDKADSGFPIALAYPLEMIVIPSPVAIFKGSTNINTAKAFADYLITFDAQQIIAANGTLPVLGGMAVPDMFNIPTVTEAMVRAVVISTVDSVSHKDDIIRLFVDIMQD